MPDTAIDDDAIYGLVVHIYRRAYDNVTGPHDYDTLDDACIEYLRARGKYDDVADDDPEFDVVILTRDEFDPAAFRLVYDYVVAHARYHYTAIRAVKAARDPLVAYDDELRRNRPR